MKESSCRAASIILIHFTWVLQQVQDLPDGSVSVTHLFSKPLLFNSSVWIHIWLKEDIVVVVILVLVLLLQWLKSMNDWTQHWASLDSGSGRSGAAGDRSRSLIFYLPLCHLSSSVAKLRGHQCSPFHSYLFNGSNFIHSFSRRGQEDKVIKQSQSSEGWNFWLSKWLLKSQTLRLFWSNPLGRVPYYALKFVSYFLSHESRK